MKKQLGIAAIGVATVLSILLTSGEARADTWNFGDWTVVEIDSFLDGGTAGNTVDFINPANFWGSTSTANDDNYWRERDYIAFETGYLDAVNAAGGTSNGHTYEIGAADSIGAPELRTTVGGLTAGDYEVALLYTTRNDGSADVGHTMAILNDSFPTTIYDHTTVLATIGTTASVWETSLASLGTITNATDFSVNVLGVDGPGRTHAIGVAYRSAVAVPEPGSFALIGSGLLVALVRRRR